MDEESCTYDHEDNIDNWFFRRSRTTFKRSFGNVYLYN